VSEVLLIKTALGLATATVLFAFAAATALAEPPVWQGCKEFKNGRFEDSKCSTKGAAKKFDWIEASIKAQTAASEGTLKLADTKTGLTVQCSTTSTEAIGSVENASVGEVKEVKAKSCSVIKGTCAEPSMEAVNLPWKMELGEAGETEIRNKVKTATKSPGWKILCGKVATDTCEGATSAKMTNNEKEGLVEAELEGKSEKSTCSSGGTGEALGVSKTKITEKGIGATKVAKASNFKMTASPRVIKKNEKSTITIKAVKAAETSFLEEDDPDKAFNYLPAEIKLCEGKYAAKETCKFVTEYVGNELSLFVVLLLDENGRAAVAVVVGE
jgi:hypothetical protein